jgi:hypothetical protein
MSEQLAPKENSNLQKGCFIALAVLAAFGAVCGGLFGYFGYRASQNPEAQKAFKAMGAGYGLFKEMRNLPGAAELRAAGCDEAVIFDKDRINEFTVILEEESKMEWDSIACMMHQNERPSELTCEEVARIYARAVPDEKSFMVSIMIKSVEDEEYCQGIYSPEGKLIRGLDEGEQNPASSGSFNIDLKKEE